MIFQKRVERAMEHTHAKAVEREAASPHPDVDVEDITEKGDLPAMMLAGVFTILPVAILVLAILVLAGYFFLMR